MSIFKRMSEYLNNDQLSVNEQIDKTFFEGNPADTILYVELSHKANSFVSKQDIFLRLPEPDRYGHINYQDFYSTVKDAGGKISLDYQARLPIDMHQWIEELGLKHLLTTEADAMLKLFSKDGE